jgi:hypothetical protein
VKERIAPIVVRQRLGWTPLVLGTLLVLPDDSTPRRRIAKHRLTFLSRFPDSGASPRPWLKNPIGRFAAIWFLSPTGSTSGKQPTASRERVRRPKSPSEPLPEQ